MLPLEALNRIQDYRPIWSDLEGALRAAQEATLRGQMLLRQLREMDVLPPIVLLDAVFNAALAADDFGEVAGQLLTGRRESTGQ